MTTPAIQDIAAMHAAYVQGTGLQIPLDSARELTWYEVWRRGIRADDIRLVITHMKRRAKAQQSVRSFVFRRFVGDADFLEEDIAEARRDARTPRPPRDRAAVLQASGRPPAPEPPTSRPAGEILSQSTILAEMERLRKEIENP